MNLADFYIMKDIQIREEFKLFTFSRILTGRIKERYFNFGKIRINSIFSIGKILPKQLEIVCYKKKLYLGKNDVKLNRYKY